MAEYIERRRVSNACYEIFEETVRAGRNMNAAEIRQLLLKFEKAINATPAADVAPVVHAQWIGNVCDFYCSACGIYQSLYVGRTKYCPRCGAKME